MKKLIKLFTLCLLLLSIVSNARAIDIEPEHDAMEYDTNDTIKTPSNESQTLAPIPPAITRQDLPATQSVSNQVTQPVTMQPVTTMEPQGQRIYYARSVTSNNPEYKTRFSILHNTPSPKRIGGERLYNLSESFFRLAVDGNRIEILDNPVFKLVGINSAKGRYGQIKVLDGAVLNVHGTSKRFRGKWDLDGTGERNLKITPTNLVSGTIPVHYQTFTADGSVVSDEIHDLNFKAMAMGPYNGYWSDGADIGIFLWGMSAAKLKSQEMAYLGLDLGIVTHNSPEATGSTAAPNLSDNAAIVPIAPLGSMVPASPSGATSSIMPFGGGNYNPAPFIGGFSGGFGGFGGGFIGGGGGGSTSTIVNQGDTINNITNNVNEVTNNGGEVINNNNQITNNIVNNGGDIINNNEVINNNNQINNSGCIVNANGDNNTNSANVNCNVTNNINEVTNNGDGDIINNNNQNTNNNQVINNGDGDVVNNNDQSNDVINDNIINNIDNDGGCVINNINQGNDNIINNDGTIKCVAGNDVEDICSKNPFAPGCENFCTENPHSPRCCALHPERCDPVDPCEENPASLHCNPSTPVSEPFAPFALLIGLAGYIGLRRRKK